MRDSSGRPTKTHRNAAPQRISDDELSAVSGAGPSKAKASGANLPHESVTLNYGAISWVYT